MWRSCPQEPQAACLHEMSSERALRDANGAGKRLRVQSQACTLDPCPGLLDPEAADFDETCRVGSLAVVA